MGYRSMAAPRLAYMGPKRFGKGVLLAHLQGIPGLVLLDLKSKKLVNRLQRLRINSSYANPRALFRLFELVLNISFKFFIAGTPGGV
jgi:hypothetical protein